MRGAAIGFLSLLLGVAILLYLFAGKGCTPNGKSYLGGVADAKKKYEPIAQQMNGNDAQGAPFHQSLTVAPWPATGGTLRGLQVQGVDPAGVAATYYGLRAGDVIEEIGPQAVGGYVVTDEQTAIEFLDDAFARAFPLTVRRDGEKVTLSGTSYQTAIQTPAGGTATPGAPAAPPAGNGTTRVPVLPFPTPGQ